MNATDFGLSLRIVVREDVPQLVELARAEFPETGLTSKLLRQAMSPNEAVSILIEDDHLSVLGFLIYHISRDSIEIGHFFVGAYGRELGADVFAIDRLKSKLKKTRPDIRCVVRLSNLPLLNFLRDQRFLSLELLPDLYENPNDDGVVMIFSKDFSE